MPIKQYYPGSRLPMVSDTKVPGLIPLNVLAGKTILGVAGTATNDANATAADIANALIAYVNGLKVIGNGANARRKATGSGTTDAGSGFAVSGLAFTPSIVVVDLAGATAPYNTRKTYWGGSAHLNLNSFIVNESSQGANASPWTISAGGFSTYMFSGNNGLAVVWIAIE